jgi:hypothetical protein
MTKLPTPKLLSGLFLLAFAAPTVDIRYFLYQRPVQLPAGTAGQACVVLDPTLFSHAAPGLTDLRLYNGAAETPYALQTSEAISASPQQIAILNAGRRMRQTVFDAEMPQGSYTDLTLAISAHDFIATVTVSGSQAQDAAPTRVGAYTIFDLSGQKLGRSTILHLPNSDFRFLHFSIAGPLTPGSITGLTVSQRPVIEPEYVAVAQSKRITLQGRDSVISFTLPPHVRIVFVPGPQPPAFSRDVEVQVASIAPPPKTADINPDLAPPPQPVTSFGNLLRVHRVQNGLRIDEENLTVDPPYAGFDGPTQWTVTVRNGDDAPIQLTSVRLEMRKRTLCFDAAPGAAYALYYGDAVLSPPRYDYASLFVARLNAVDASFGPEQANPSYQPRPDERPFTEKHPALLWIALGLVVALLALVALRSVKLTGKSSS